MTSVAPFVIFVTGAIVVLPLRGRARSIVLLSIPLLGGLNLIGLEHGVHWSVPVFDQTLLLFQADKLSLLFGYLFHIAAFISIIYSLHVTDRLQPTAGLIYAGSALGAVFAGDLITLFIFWELMTISSVFLIWARGTQRAVEAGIRYFVVQVISGVCLLAGTLLYYHDTGSIVFGYIGVSDYASGLIFMAFGIKCAFPLFHGWLTDAYPEATETGTVFLSAFTTKVAVYALARAFPGTEALVYIGAVMTCFPIFYAVIENDLRRVLAYSLINQLGFMVCGIGIGTALAVNGAVAHAFTDVIFKGLLFMSMGAVLFRTACIKGSDLGGLYRTMPKTTALCIIGAASISAFPLFSGFVSKSMVMSAALEEGYHVVWLFLLFASAGVFHHAGIKIPFFAFFAHDSGLRPAEAPVNMLIAMTIAALLCIFIGSYPWLLYGWLPFTTEYTPYDATHVIAQLQLLFYSALAFTWLKLSGMYPPELRSLNLDVEWLYRRFIPVALVKRTFAWIEAMDDAGRAAVNKGVEAVSGNISRHHGPEGVMTGTWPTGRMVLSVTVVLGVFLIFYYFG